MDLAPFRLERYFARHEFSARYLLGCSDCQPLTMSELLEMAQDDTLSMWHSLSLGYTESQGLPLLRDEIASLYDAVSADEVVTVVPEEGIFLAMNALLQPGDHLIATFPGYQSLYGVAQAIGCRVSQWKPREGADWRFHLDDLMPLLESGTKLIVVNFPHNPTGATLDSRAWRELVGIAETAGARLFSDEMYRFLEFDPADRLPSAAILSDTALSLSGLSKAFALPGLRLGWLTTQDTSLMERLCTLKDYTTICGSAPSEMLGLIALRARQTIVARNLALVRRGCEAFASFFDRHTDRFRWLPPRAGSVAFPRLLSGDATSLCAGLMQAEGVLVVPGSELDFDDSHFRVGLGREGVEAGIDRFEAYLQHAPRV